MRVSARCVFFSWHFTVFTVIVLVLYHTIKVLLLLIPLMLSFSQTAAVLSYRRDLMDGNGWKMSYAQITGGTFVSVS